MPKAKRKRKDPEDALIKHVGRKTGRSKGETIRLLKGTGQLRQAGKHLEPTAKGRKAIKKVKSRRS